jgi:hypothetical protein
MKYFFLLLFTTNICNCFSQQTDSAFVFKGFGAGGSTASLHHYSRMVDTLKYVTKVKMDVTALDTLNYLMAQIKPRKHRQQKIGPSFYASVYINGVERRIALVPRWAIIDLENKRQYSFSNTPYAAIYDRFITRHYQ